MMTSRPSKGSRLAEIQKSPSHVGVGLYSIAEAARIVRAHPETVRRWLCEDDGLVKRYFDPKTKLLSFIELIEVHFINIFRQEGVPLPVIRKVSEVASIRLKTDYPFAVKRFDTDGKTVFATLLHDQEKSELIEDLNHSQYVFTSVMRPFFHKLEYKGMDETVIRFWPRGKRGRIVLDPLRKFGKPIDAETGVATRAIFDAVMAGGGQTQAVVAGWLGIPKAAVKAAVEFEQSLAA
jgi:uncharacterized protein (DUF433 family)